MTLCELQNNLVLERSVNHIPLKTILLHAIGEHGSFKLVGKEWKQVCYIFVEKQIVECCLVKEPFAWVVLLWFIIEPGGVYNWKKGWQCVIMFAYDVVSRYTNSSYRIALNACKRTWFHESGQCVFLFPFEKRPVSHKQSSQSTVYFIACDLAMGCAYEQTAFTQTSLTRMVFFAVAWVF